MVMKEIVRDVSQATTVIKAGIHLIVREAVLMATVEIVHARAALTTSIKDRDDRVVMKMVEVVHVRVVHTTIIKAPVVRAIVIEAAPIVTMATLVVLQAVPVTAAPVAEIRAEALPEIQAGVHREMVVHKVAPAPIHQMEEVKILLTPVAHAANRQVRVANNQVMVGKVREDVKKALRKVHRAKNNDRNQAKNRACPYSLLFPHY